MSDRPRRIDDIKANPKLMAAYLKYAASSQILNEVKFYFDKGNAAALYPKYIDPDADQAVNVSDKVVKAARLLAAQNDFDNKAWDTILKNAKAEVGHTLTNETMKFYSSDAYKEYVKKERMGDPAKAAKLLGISDVKKLTAAMEAMAVDDKKTAEKLFGEIAKKEKLQMKAEQMIKNLKAAGF
jgi:hypothetical protein